MLVSRLPSNRSSLRLGSIIRGNSPSTRLFVRSIVAIDGRFHRLISSREVNELFCRYNFVRFDRFKIGSGRVMLLLERFAISSDSRLDVYSICMSDS
jgi:hypothetical protein